MPYNSISYSFAVLVFAAYGDVRVRSFGSDLEFYFQIVNFENKPFSI